MSLVLLFTACLADIRPVSLDAAVDLATDDGRDRLRAAAEAHGGLAAWEAKQTTELILRDTWAGLPRLFNPWPDAVSTVHLVQRPRTFDSTATFVGGSRDGITWGIDDWEVFEIDAAGQRTATSNKNARFMLPTTQYFVELPFRILEAEIVRFVGPTTIEDRVYDVVYATWGSEAKNRDFDQYLLFVSQDTGRIEKVQYTVREVASFVTGTCHLDDQRPIDGIWISHRMTVTVEPTDDVDDGWIHQMLVQELRFDTADRGTLLIRPSLPSLIGK